MLLIEILGITAATLILAFCAGVLVRQLLSFRKTMNRFTNKVNAKALHLMDQAEAAERRAVSITKARELLIRKVFLLRVDLLKIKVIITAVKQAWSPVARVKAYIGL